MSDLDDLEEIEEQTKYRPERTSAQGPRKGHSALYFDGSSIRSKVARRNRKTRPITLAGPRGETQD